MVWHAYKLNPQCYLEDCLRFGNLGMLQIYSHYRDNTNPSQVSSILPFHGLQFTAALMQMLEHITLASERNKASSH